MNTSFLFNFSVLCCSGTVCDLYRIYLFFVNFNGRQLPDLLLRPIWYKVRLCQTTNQSTHCGEVYNFNVDSRVCDPHFSGA